MTLVSGFVTWELFTEWPAAEKVFLIPPVWAAKALGSAAAAGWFEGAWALAVVPLVLWWLLAGAVRLLGDKESVFVIWRRMALPMAVVASVGHLSKGLAKFVSWSPFLPGALRDPDGVATAQAITAKTLAMPAALLSPFTVSVICLGLVVAAFFFSVREYRLAHPESPLRLRLVLPMAVVALAFLGIIAGWSRH